MKNSVVNQLGWSPAELQKDNTVTADALKRQVMVARDIVLSLEITVETGPSQREPLRVNEIWFTIIVDLSNTVILGIEVLRFLETNITRDAILFKGLKVVSDGNSKLDLLNATTKKKYPVKILLLWLLDAEIAQGDDTIKRQIISTLPG